MNIICPDCRAEHLLTFSCKTRGICPSCHAKSLEERGEWVRETLLLDVPHRQVVFTVPKMLQVFLITTQPPPLGRRQDPSPAPGGYRPAGTRTTFSKLRAWLLTTQVILTLTVCLPGRRATLPKEKVFGK